MLRDENQGKESYTEPSEHKKTNTWNLGLVALSSFLGTLICLGFAIWILIILAGTFPVVALIVLVLGLIFGTGPIVSRRNKNDTN